MLLSASEGRHWRYEVLEHEDGYLVQMRDLEDGELDDDFATIFRTMPVAFAYAEMSAALDRYAAAELDKVEDAEAASDAAVTERSFLDLSTRLRDNGIQGPALRAWERRHQSGPRRVLH